MPSAWLRLVLLVSVTPLSAQTHVSWSQSAASSTSGPGGRAGAAHTPQALSENTGSALADMLWMFGGIHEAQPLNYSAELWSYTASTNAWEMMPASPTNGPPARVGSAMCAVGHSLYVYGGASFEAGAHNDLHRFNTAQRQWQRMVLPGVAPGALAYHSMSCAGGKAYVSGGEDASGTLQREMYAINDIGTGAVAWSRIGLSGAPPTARRGHSLTSSGSRLYLFGGRGPSSTLLNDAYYYDTGSTVWTSLATVGELPSGREGHSAVILSERLYVFAGFDGYGSLNEVRHLPQPDLPQSVLPQPVSFHNEAFHGPAVHGGLSTAMPSTARPPTGTSSTTRLTLLGLPQPPQPLRN